MLNYDFPLLDWAVVIPLANEQQTFQEFAARLTEVLNTLQCGQVYLIVDKASKDNTVQLCRNLSESDRRFVTVWSPENKNLVDAYLAGFREAVSHGHEYIIEMDGGLSHFPEEIFLFLQELTRGNDCVFGSRFLRKGDYEQPPFNRLILSRCGTLLSNFLLRTTLRDMTSGFQGFRREVICKILAANLRSTGHFYQTEVRYLLRRSRFAEIPIRYRSPSPRVSHKSILNSLSVLWFYFTSRMRGKPLGV